MKTKNVSFKSAMSSFNLLWCLCIIAFAGLLSLATIRGRYAGKELEVWGWFLIRTVPILSLILGSLLAGTSYRKINLTLLKWTHFVSILFFVVLFASFLASPLAWEYGEIPPIKFMYYCGYLLNFLTCFLFLFLGALIAK